jgi:hypothetical protein
MSQPAARAAAARSPSEPDSARMLRSSLMRAPSKPISPRITVLMMVGDKVAGRAGSSAG